MTKKEDRRLTILTDRVPSGSLFVRDVFRSYAKRLKALVIHRRSWTQSHYGGHLAVTRSLVEGLRKVGVEFTYNPKILAHVGQTVVVLNGVGALQQAIGWKKRGRIQKLLAGPNILVWPSEHPEIAAPEVDVCITPSPWTCNAYEIDLPALKGRCVPWPAGVDVAWWKPTRQFKERKRARLLLFFIKESKGPIPEINPFVDVARSLGYGTRELHYGEYSLAEYRDCLSNSLCMVGFVRDESQGIAWAEAWAMDVPTLIWWNEKNLIRGKETRVSTAPYLSPQTGAFFKDRAEFDRLLKCFSENAFSFSPRQWVLNNMSDEVCAQNLYHIAGG